MIPLLRSARRLRRAGVLGLNRRNAAFMLPHNPRRNYPAVDDKLLTKRLAEAAGIPVPHLCGTVEHYHELHRLPDRLAALREFVLKPAHGAQGNGIVVLTGADGGFWRRANGAVLTLPELRQHVANVIAGVFSLSGDTDACLIEERVGLHPAFVDLAVGGIPDLRVIVFRGVPVMSMCRLPTRASAGRANLHQGAVAVGLDMLSGLAVHASHHNRTVTTHADTGAPIAGFRVPDWDAVLALATRSSEIAGLGYIGVDIVLDPHRGPLLLEFNARPGLGIQVANNAGLLPRLEKIAALPPEQLQGWENRCALVRALFA